MRRSTYAMLWSLMIVVLSLYVTALWTLAWIYLNNRKTNSMLWILRAYYVYTRENDFLLRYSDTIGAIYAVIGGVYAFFALRMLGTTLKHRRLGFGGAVSAKFSRHHSMKAVFRTASDLSTRVVQPIGQRIQHWRHCVGVYGRFFELRLLADETVEIATQLYAAYTASLNLSNQPLNIVFACLICINNVSTVCLRWAYRRSVIRMRIAWLFTDFVLDFLWGTAIPMCMVVSLMSRYKNFVLPGGDLDATVNATREVERVLVLSWTSFLVSAIPFCNSFLSLVELVSILQEQPQRHTAKDAPVAPSVGQQPVLTLSLTEKHIVPYRTKAMEVVHTLTALCGVAVLIVALFANFGVHPNSEMKTHECLHRVYPWFVTKEACIGRHINCSSANFSGTEHELMSELAHFDQTTLSDLIITDCPSIEVPAALKGFHRIDALSIQNSAIASWSADVSLSAAHFGNLKALFLSNIIVVGTVPGLTSSRLSPSIEWIGMISFPNASNVFAELANTGHWRDVVYLNCDWCLLTEFPSFVFTMSRLKVLTLSFSDIPEVPDTWVEQSPSLNLQFLWLESNPRLQYLPDNVWARLAETAEMVNIVGTNVSQLPTWIYGEFLLAASNTPLCSSGANLSTNAQAIVNCDAAQ